MNIPDSSSHRCCLRPQLVRQSSDQSSSRFDARTNSSTTLKPSRPMSTLRTRSCAARVVSVRDTRVQTMRSLKFRTTSLWYVPSFFPVIHPPRHLHCGSVLESRDYLQDCVEHFTDFQITGCIFLDHPCCLQVAVGESTTTFGVVSISSVHALTHAPSPLVVFSMKRLKGVASDCSGLN